MVVSLLKVFSYAGDKGRQRVYQSNGRHIANKCFVPGSLSKSINGTVTTLNGTKTQAAIRGCHSTLHSVTHGHSSFHVQLQWHSSDTCSVTHVFVSHNGLLALQNSPMLKQ